MYLSELKLPQGIEQKELYKMLAEYVQTRDPELKERICLGSLRLLAKLVRVYHKANMEKSISEVDLFAETCVKLYDKYIDLYANQIAKGSNFPYHLFLTGAIRKVFYQKNKSSRVYTDFYAKNGFKLVEDKKGRPYSYFIEMIDNPRDFYIQQEAAIELKEVLGYVKYLTPREQMVFKLFIFKNVEQKEIASEFGLQPASISLILKNVRTKLSKYYEGELEPNDKLLKSRTICEFIRYLPSQQNIISRQFFFYNKNVEEIAMLQNQSIEYVAHELKIIKAKLKLYTTDIMLFMQYYWQSKRAETEHS